MSVIETNWNPTQKDLRLFGLIAAGIFGVMWILSFVHIPFIGTYLGRLLSWQMMTAIAVFSAIGAGIVPKDQKIYGIGGAIVFAVLAMLTATHVLMWGRWLTLTVAVAFAAVSIFQSHFMRPVYLSALVATFPLGLVLGPVIMGVIFFGIFTPIALVFRLMGRDTMCRKFDPMAKSYWIPHKPITSAERYFRQF